MYVALLPSFSPIIFNHFIGILLAYAIAFAYRADSAPATALKLTCEKRYLSALFVLALFCCTYSRAHSPHHCLSLIRTSSVTAYTVWFQKKYFVKTRISEAFYLLCQRGGIRTRTAAFRGASSGNCVAPTTISPPVYVRLPISPPAFYLLVLHILHQLSVRIVCLLYPELVYARGQSDRLMIFPFPIYRRPIRLIVHR